MPDVLTITLNPAVDVSTSVERIEPVHKLRCAPGRRDPGGGGVNVARVIARLGGDVAAVFPAGGPVGELLHRLVLDEGLAARAIPISGVTRESFTVLERATNNEYRFVLPGPALTPTEFNKCLSSVEQTHGARYAVASGSLPPGAPVDGYARIATAVKAGGGRFVLDASGEALQCALTAGVYLVKPNAAELETLFGSPLKNDAAILAAARDLIGGGAAEIVAVSRGSRGAILVTADEALAAESVAVPVASSVGAGDSFLGALVWSLARGDVLETAFRYALAGGAAALLRPGTELCTQADVERLAPLVQIRRL